MKNLVNQIAAEAGIKYSSKIQKFAELVAQECIAICYEQSQTAKYSFTPKRAQLVEMTLRNAARLIENKTHDKIRQSDPKRKPK